MVERTQATRSSSSGGSQIATPQRVPLTPTTTPTTAGGGPRRTQSASSAASGGGGPPPPNLMMQSPPLRGSSGSLLANHHHHAAPPPVVPQQSQSQSQLSQSMAKSMTIEQMRELHHRALSEAEAKRTELRLVLASRYRELVGSSDEVIKMRERSQELYDLVHALPQLMEKVASTKGGAAAGGTETEEEEEEEEKQKEETTETKEAEGSAVVEDESTSRLRRDLSLLPRVIHRALDKKDVHKATVSLIQLFTLIASQTDAYPLANTLSTTTRPTAPPNPNTIEPALEAQMRMIFLQVQTLPDKVRRISTKILARAASYGGGAAGSGAIRSAAALASLNFLDSSADQKKHDRAERLLSTYFEAKAKLLVSLLGKLTTEEGRPATDSAEEILSKIVLILQHDVVVHPYQIFIIRKFPGEEGDEITRTLPLFEKEAVKAKCSKFLAAHLPLIRTKVKSVLVNIAGTTASALGQIRQSLYDKTDGAESMERLNENGVCTWDEAVFSMIDFRTVLNSADTEANQQDRFSLWGALFSSTFSSLVHSLLTTAFQSVHTSVISTLRDSLSNAPPVAAILPHEAYRNTLKIATDLDQSLLKVSADAHELLVHAEERVESERRLRQSLYVQTCEIMGRLICELRRIAHRSSDDDSDATKELIVGRLCFLLKFRLTSLKTLLSPDSSPASMQSTGGMISFVDLHSAFDLADDDEDGLITFDEAVGVVDSAFMGTPFNGAEMIRETLLLSSANKDTTTASPGASINVALTELTLLTARGLRHAKDGSESALGTIQMSLDDIVHGCFQRWARLSLKVSATNLQDSLHDFILTASSVSSEEWNRLFSSGCGASPTSCRGVSPHVLSYMLDVAMALNRNICPSDSLAPVPTTEYASSLGVITKKGETVPTLMDTMRWALLCESFVELSTMFEEAVTSETGSDLERSSPVALVQLHIDVHLVKTCYLEKNQNGFGPGDAPTTHLETVMSYTDQLLQKACDAGTIANLASLTSDKHQRVLETSNLFFSALFGDDTGASVSPAGELMGSSEGTDPLFHVPLASSRRFALLPVQADRSLSDIQIRGKYAKEKEEEIERNDTRSGNVISGGLGFLSSMLKTKK